MAFKGLIFGLNILAIVNISFFDLHAERTEAVGSIVEIQTNQVRPLALPALNEMDMADPAYYRLADMMDQIVRNTDTCEILNCMRSRVRPVCLHGTEESCETLRSGPGGGYRSDVNLTCSVLHFPLGQNVTDASSEPGRGSMGQCLTGIKVIHMRLFGTRLDSGQEAHSANFLATRTQTDRGTENVFERVPTRDLGNLPPGTFCNCPRAGGGSGHVEYLSTGGNWFSDFSQGPSHLCGTGSYVPRRCYRLTRAGIELLQRRFLPSTTAPIESRTPRWGLGGVSRMINPYGSLLNREQARPTDWLGRPIVPVEDLSLWDQLSVFRPALVPICHYRCGTEEGIARSPTSRCAQE